MRSSGGQHQTERVEMEFPDAITLSSSVLQQYCDHIHILPPEGEVDNIRPTFNKTSQELPELVLIQKCYQFWNSHQQPSLKDKHDSPGPPLQQMRGDLASGDARGLAESVCVLS